MGNFKVKVNSEAESKEAQELFLKLGYSKGACSEGNYPAVIVTTQDWATGEYCSTRALGLDIPAHDNYKEITLAELRAMVNPMKEYLDANRNYEFVLSTEKEDGFIEIPEGADEFSVGGCFYKDKRAFYWDSDKNQWNSKPWLVLSDARWKRQTQPEELTFVDGESINDQYAEIEQVRQHRHYFIDVSDVDEIDFYEIALRYNVTDPCIQHILKKCLAVGQRGQKDFHHDLKDIYDTAKRMLAVHGLDS